MMFPFNSLICYIVIHMNKEVHKTLTEFYLSLSINNAWQIPGVSFKDFLIFDCVIYSLLRWILSELSKIYLLSIHR